MEQAKNKLKQSAARLSVVSNIMLVIGKLGVGLFTGAVSIVSEAAHSGVDLIAALVAFYAVRKSGKPPDEDHAYGHGKVENLSGAAEALLILGAAVWIVYEAIGKLAAARQPEFIEYGIAIMLVSAIVNYFVSKHLYKVARQTGSHALEADALHLRTDIWTSAGVFAGLLLIRITGLYWLDPAIAIIVAGVVFKAGYEMTKKSVYELTDISLPEEEEQIIREILKNQPEVITFHQLRTRRSGSYRLVDMHLILSKHMHLDKAHDICDKIEEAIKARLGLCDVVIHLEPCDHQEGLGTCPLLPPQEKRTDK
ncbi:cation diffusion facilitator family transporter [Lucifera butyrica]|uniref:cation diffusion facilitator family transporter n=1 Tax=Lucifera butyrica TaxID=1351585 RepID=UPI001A9E2243|nr:cation diffusion facilitator family transporter [Lucifera butyrica]